VEDNVELARTLAAPALVLSIIFAASRTSLAAGGAATDAYEEIREGAVLDVHGLADFYVQHDFNRPRSGTSQLRAFDGRSDVLSPSFVRLTVAHRPDLFGFRLDVGLGDTPDGYLRADPALSTYPRLSRALSYVEQAFVTARVPAGRGVAVDVGKFGTPIGLEDNEAPQNWCYSRSLLYAWAEPTSHTGLRATYPATETLAFSAFWVNGWNANIVAGNGMRSFAGAATWHPFEALDASVAYMGGPERAPTRLDDPRLAFRHELDVFATYAPTPRVSFAVSVDYGRDAADGGVWWGGLAGYIHCRVRPWLAGTLRAERFADPDGFVTGTKQRVAEVTGTIEVSRRVSDVTLTSRFEYRRDQSDARPFEAAGGARRAHQDTLALGLMLTF
jgi:hypothetical protein